MGIGVSTQWNETQQESINDFYQESRSTCTANARDLQQNEVINIGAGAKTGDIRFTQQAISTAACVLNSQLDSLETDKLDSIQNQQDKQGAIILGLRINTQVNKTRQSLQNTITQIINSACSATSENIQENITVNIGERAETGDIAFEQQANAEASCAIENMARLTSYSDLSSSETQSNVFEGLDLGFLLLLIIIVAIVAIVIVRQAGKAAKAQAKAAGDSGLLKTGLKLAATAEGGPAAGAAAGRLLG